MGTFAEVVSAPRQSRLGGSAPAQQVGVIRAIAACVIGATIALSGFPPLNNIPGMLHVDALPGFVLLTPAVLVTALAVWMSLAPTANGTVSSLSLIAIGLVLLGGSLSVAVSTNASYSLALLILGILAPGCLFLAVRRGNLPAAILAGSFLAALTAALLRADLVFLMSYGLPTPAELFAAKFSNHAYDFHYYTLGNPDHTATFLLLPLTVNLIWLRDGGLSRRARLLLIAATAVITLTILLLYVRLPMLVAFLLLVAAVSRSSLSRRIRLTILVAAAVFGVVLVAKSPSNYLTHFFSTSSTSSGGVRLNSISDGFRTLEHHLFTGVGLGQYGAGNGLPAHSSVVQAGAEMGLAGLLGIALITIALPIAAIVRARRVGLNTLASASLAGAAVYVAAAAVSAGADEGLLVGAVSIYGLTLALFAGIGLAPAAALDPVPLAVSFHDVGDLVAERTRRAVRSLFNASRLGWIAYGLIWMPIAALLTSPRLAASGNVSSSRLQDLENVLVAHQHGFGPLVGMRSPGNFYPAGITDDPGGYLVTPWISDLLHTTNVGTIVRALFLVLFCAMVALYPYTIRRMSGSRIAAALSPVFVLLCFRFLTDDSFYWIPAVTVAVCLPWLLTFARERTAPLGPLVVIAAVAGVTEIFRADTGLGLVIGCIALTMLTPATWRRRAGGAALIALAYIGLSSGVLSLAFQVRGERMQGYPLHTNGEAGVTSWSDPSGHPFWHTVYIGLGVVPNRYGITYSDSVAAAYVRSVDPSAPYVGPRYEAILRSRVLHLLTSDPGFILRAERQKLGDILADGLRMFWPLLVLVPFALMMGIGRRRWKRYCAVLVPVAVIAVLPSLVAVPVSNYEMPWLALLATLEVLVCCWVVGSVWDWATNPQGLLRRHQSTDGFIAAVNRQQLRWSTLTDAAVNKVRGATLPAQARSSRLAAGTAATPEGFGPLVPTRETRHSVSRSVRSPAVYVAIAVVVGGFAARAYLDGWQSGVSASSAPPAGARALPYNAEVGSAVHIWKLGALPAGWTVVRGAGITPGAALRVDTSARTNAYQLMSPVVPLSPGIYSAAVRGEIRTGGMYLGVLDVRTNSWIRVVTYYHVSPPTGGTMTDHFTISRAMPVQVILSDGAPFNRSSDWLLDQISIVRQSPAVPAATAPAAP